MCDKERELIEMTQALRGLLIKWTDEESDVDEIIHDVRKLVNTKPEVLEKGEWTK